MNKERSKPISKRELRKAARQGKTFCSIQFIEGEDVINITNGNPDMILDFIANAVAWVFCEAQVTTDPKVLDKNLRYFNKTVRKLYEYHSPKYSD